MSTGQECLFIERRPGEWYLVLEDLWQRNAWDWRETATATGPFATLDLAQQHLSDYHANPGGWMEEPYVEGKAFGPTMERLFEEASRPTRRSMW